MADAPYATICGPYSLVKETVILPRGGAGFSFPAPDVDQQVAGCALSRHSHFDKGVFTMERSMRSLTPEFPASEAAAANKTLAELAKTQVFLRTPLNYLATDADIAVMAAVEPTTASGYIDRGNSYSARHDYDKAIADFTKAAAINPKESYAFSDRGLASYWRKQDDLAKVDFEAAAKLNPRDVAAVHGQGLLAVRSYRYRDAIANFSRAVDLKPDNVFALNYRADLYTEVGEYDHALADLDELLRISPGNANTHLRKSRLLGAQGNRKDAATETEAALKINPADQNAQLLHGGQLIQVGQRAEGMAVLASAIAAHPTAGAYLARAGGRERSDRAGRRADIEAALKADPKSMTAQMMLADVRSESGAHAEAIAKLTAALKDNPGNESLLLGRARAYARSGNVKSADDDLTEITLKEAANPGMLNNVCFTRATFGVQLTQALIDCDHSLAINPTSPATLDSRAFVLLRLGRLEESVAAYDLALKRRPDLAASLYGRGLAKLGLKRVKEGEADLAAGKALLPAIAATFAEWGMPAPAATAA
jgi:tetratricopeptide (TPR) repeat protein